MCDRVPIKGKGKGKAQLRSCISCIGQQVNWTVESRTTCDRVAHAL